MAILSRFIVSRCCCPKTAEPPVEPPTDYPDIFLCASPGVTMEILGSVYNPAQDTWTHEIDLVCNLTSHLFFVELSASEKECEELFLTACTRNVMVGNTTECCICVDPIQPKDPDYHSETIIQVTANDVIYNTPRLLPKLTTWSAFETEVVVNSITPTAPDKLTFMELQLNITDLVNRAITGADFEHSQFGDAPPADRPVFSRPPDATIGPQVAIDIGDTIKTEIIRNDPTKQIADSLADYTYQLWHNGILLYSEDIGSPGYDAHVDPCTDGPGATFAWVRNVLINEPSRDAEFILTTQFRY